MEHTGIYNNPLLSYLHQKQANVWLEQATQIKASMGVSREKNDKVDSQKIGLYAYKNREDIKIWTPKRPVIVQIDRLTALRDRLVKSIKVLKTPFSDAKGLVDKKILNSETSFCQSSMDAMKEDIKAVDKKIKELIDQEPILKELFDIAE